MRRYLIVLLAALMLALCACGSELQQGPTTAPPDAAVRAGINVEKVEGLSESFIMGADVSSLLALEASGVVFHDFEGNVSDCLKVLADAGVNCIRVRVWNDPFDAKGNGYGGGSCNIDTAVEIGERAAKYGMSLLLDLHYSDFWADPSKQMAPKAWADMDMDAKTEAVYAYTVDCLNILAKSEVRLYMVQIGNETTTGFCGEDSVPRVMRLMASASDAIRKTAPEALICVHYTNPEDGKYSLYASNLDVNGVDYDVFASSYYPYWHGTLDNLREQLGKVADKYGKRVMVAETSYAYTLDDTDDSANTIGSDPSYEKGWPFTVQGQSRELREVIATVASLGEAGLGVFYWEPAWIAVPGESYEQRLALWERYGSGWASSWAAEYDPDDAGVYYGGSACDNQALFDSEGMPLESLLTFKYVYTGAETELKTDAVEPVYIPVRKNNPISLPETVTAVMNDGSQSEVAVAWEDTDLAALSASETGSYEIKGEAGGLPVSCYVMIQDENYLENPGFESADYTMWQIEAIAPGKQTDFQQKRTDAFTGEWSLHFWNSESVEWQVTQSVSKLRPGTYRFSIHAQGGDVGDNATLYIFANADGKHYEQSFELTGWRAWTQPVIEGISCESGEITVGAYLKAPGGAWGTLDDFVLSPVE